MFRAFVHHLHAAVAQSVECHLGKVEVLGSIPDSSTTLCISSFSHALVAQLVERRVEGAGVVGSNPTRCTIFKVPRGRPDRIFNREGRRRGGTGLRTITSLPTPHPAWVAQLVEQRAENPRVAGSSPAPSTIYFRFSFRRVRSDVDKQLCRVLASAALTEQVFRAVCYPSLPKTPTC